MNMDQQLRKYAPIWNKYRPAILKMMVDAANGPQKYRLMPHELQAMDSKKKNGFAFSIQTSGRKATKSIKDSEIAQDLLNMLLLSKRGLELLESKSFEFAVDKQFMLHVSEVNTAAQQTENVN
jgi:hypothetical protein